MLDFGEIKKIKIIEVCARYGIRLRYRGEWANAPCPLPTHNVGDRGRNFTVNLSQNYWRCFSESCNEKNGGRKGGDCINFVALMENCRERAAAAKLAEWYGLERHPTPKIVAKSEREVNQNKTGPRMEGRRPEKRPKEPSQKDFPDHNPPSDSVKIRYMEEVDAWFDALFGLTVEVAREEYWQKARNGVKQKLLESYRNGKLQRAS